MQQRTVNNIHKKNDEIVFESHTRRALANQLENHTCTDPTMETSKAIDTRIQTHNNVWGQVAVLHYQPASQINIIKHFISP